MAIIRPEVSFQFKPIFELIKQFPDFSGSLLAMIGSRGRGRLKDNYLSGQEINLHAFPKDKMGRYTVTSDVNKRRTQVKIYAYPANLFERGRILRDGRKEPGKFIVTKKLKSEMNQKVPGDVRDFENQIMKPNFKKMGLT